MTLYPHPELSQKILDVFLELVENIKHVPGCLPSFVLQPLVPSVHSDGSQSPNGLSGNDKTLIGSFSLFLFLFLHCRPLKTN